MSENITAPVITPTLRERIERGAGWLDGVRPGWRDLVNVDTLDLASGVSCVLGQVYDDESYDADLGDGFDYAIEYVVRAAPGQERTTWLAEHGFDLNYAHGFDYRPLTAAWRRYLREG